MSRVKEKITTKEKKAGEKEKKEKELEEDIKTKKETIEAREPVFELSLKDKSKRIAPLLEDSMPREVQAEKLEEFVKAVDTEKPKKESEPLYVPIYQEKTEAKYVSTVSIERFSSADEQAKPRRLMPIRETKTPMLREIDTRHWNEITKYESERPEVPTGFEPTFKHPEKKITKYKPRY
ncbi:MAG: hypothetical protein N3G19_03585 [Candidatus Pacearchaeota archaeon]|nr:hypothetical protein [Candidatus Pacearchaeota archaeon]